MRTEDTKYHRILFEPAQEASTRQCKRLPDAEPPPSVEASEIHASILDNAPPLLNPSKKICGSHSMLLT